MNQRISNLRNKMKAQNLKAVLINNLKNVYYLTNFKIFLHAITPLFSKFNIYFFSFFCSY